MGDSTFFFTDALVLNFYANLNLSKNKFIISDLGSGKF